MSDREFWLLFSVGVFALAVAIGVIYTAVETVINRHVNRALDEPFTQSTHVRTVPTPREESSHR